jgi:iron(III) transport system substrate-binding protein
MLRIPATCARAALAGLVLLATAGVAAADDIVVYNAQHESLTKSWVEAFMQETGIGVTVRNGNDTELGNQLLQEGDASPADVFLTENSPAMVMVDNAGLLAPVDPATLAQVAEPYRPGSGRWVAIAARATVFVYDKRKFPPAELPDSILDLADPQWKGRWGASPSGADFQAIVSAILETEGEAVTLDWLKSMKDNAMIYRGNGTVMKAVNAGEIDGGVIYHYYRYVDQSKTGENSGNTELHYFKSQDPGAFVSISGGGVLARSTHQKEAQEFLKWVTGKAGQEILRTGTSFEYAVGDGAQSNPGLVPLKDLQPPLIDASKLNSKRVTELMTEAGLL